MNSSANPLAFGRRQLRRTAGLFFVLWTLAVAAAVVWNAQLLRDAMREAGAQDQVALPPAKMLPSAEVPAVLWGLGALGIFLGERLMRHRIVKHLQAESEIQHQATFARFNPNPVLELSAAGEISYLNAAAAEMARALGREHPAQMLPPDTAAAVRECLATGKPKLRVETPAGPRVISWSFFPVKMSGTVHCYAGDITERKQAEEALRRSETKFRTLYDSSSDAVMLLDAKGFFDCNPATLTMFGCASREEFCTKHLADVSPLVQPDGTDSRTLANQRMATAMAKGSHRFEWLHKRAGSGEIFPAEVLLTAMELDGKPAFQAVVRDITGRRRMEDKLRQLSMAVAQSPASVVITDPAGNIEYANSKFIQVTGYTPAEILGKNPRVLKSGEQNPETYRELWQTIAAGKEWRGEFHNKKKNGELYWESASISPIRDLAGHITHYVAVKEDITTRKLAEAEREQLIQDLQSALASVKSLSGLLPICSGCKKIRDDKGYWNQVESYIQKHTQATFSHGMCPDCIRKFYPELEEDSPDDPSKGAA